MLLPVEVKFAYGMAAASEQCYALAERVSGLLCDSHDMRVAVFRRINLDRAGASRYTSLLARRLPRFVRRSQFP